MSKKTLYILGILGTILIGTLLYNIFCCQDCCKDEVQASKPALTDNSGMGNYNIFNISGDDLNYQCHDNFRFLSNSFNNIQPVNDSINTGIGLLKNYFDKNKVDKLVITGYALNSEKNTSAFPNLALARANDLKSYFVSKGIDANRFETKGEMRDAWKMSGDTLLGNADFRILEGKEISTEKTVDWADMKTKLNADPLILYFNTNQSEINLSPAERQKVADLVNYLDNVQGSGLNAVGHTDNIGDRTINTKLGLDRANFAKEYLAKNGVGADKIATSSKGPDEPIADNKTSDGKAKNRRTVITIK